MVAFSDKPILHPRSVAEWEAFLDGGPSPDGVRLQLRKKNSVAPGITYPEALDVALCFGWIDGQSARLDDDYLLQAFTPRRPRSPWSQVNREHVARLEAAGRMRDAGRAEVERAKADGRWDAAYRQKGAVVPDDLRLALEASPTAAAFFAGLGAQARFAFLFRLAAVKRAETRARRVQDYVALLAEGKTLDRSADPTRAGADGSTA